MNIAFLTSDDPFDRRAWSGILHYMFHALNRHCDSVVSLGPAAQFWQLVARCGARAAAMLLHMRIDPLHLATLSRIQARIFESRLAKTKPDIIFAPAGSTPVAHLNTKLPVVYYGDLTARLFRGYAANLTALSNWSLSQMELIEEKALSRANHLVYASDWAAESAAAHYGISKEKISVIPMGANIDELPSFDEIVSLRGAGTKRYCKLLFLGVDWHRKGGDIALAALRELRSRGISASLTVVGCSPPSGISDPDLYVIPFLDKSVPQQRQRLRELLVSSDFMLFPTRSEAFGIVCCEANAFGLPLIACKVGGVPVWNEENGIALDPGAPASAYADAVYSLVLDPEHYRRLALSSRKMFDERLNWDEWGRSMARIFKRVLKEYGSCGKRMSGP